MSNDYMGIYQGSVVDNNDVLGIGRVTCLVPQVQADQPTTWCAPIYPTVYKPNQGDIVWVQFINGDLTKPIYFSSEAVTAEKIEAGTITFDNLSGSAVSQIVTNSVAAAKVSIGDQTNRVGDPFFDRREAWVASGATLSFLTSSSPGVPAGCPKPTLVSTGNTGTALGEVSNDTNATLHTFPVTPGDVFRCFITGACGNTTTNLFAGLWVYDQAMGNATFVSGYVVTNGVTSPTQTTVEATTANAWTNYTLQTTIPATIGAGAIPCYAVPAFSVGAGSTWYLTNWQVLKANAGLLLVDGSILANGTVQGGTVIGATVETGAAPSTTGGIQMTPSGLKMWTPPVAGVTTETLNLDATTGNITMMGEFGTAPPGQAGVHINSNVFTTGIFGGVTFPTIQLNNGTSSSRQPTILTDTSGNSNLYVYGGASSSVRMGLMKLDTARARLGIENTPNDMEITGDCIDITPGLVEIRSSAPILFTINNGSALQDIECANLTAQANATVAGMVESDGTLASANAFQLTNNAVTVFRQVTAAAFNVSSDRGLKKGIKAPSIDALSAIRNMPVYEYTLDGQDTPTVGVMADDAPAILVNEATLGTKENPIPVKTLDVYAFLATLAQAVQDLDAELDAVIPSRKQNKPARKSRTFDKG